MDESHSEGRPDYPAADDVRLERRGLERRTLHRFKQAAPAAFAWRRCLVPADAFYEWKSGKQPYAIARQDGMPVTFAGIWEGWRAPDGEVLRTFAILTTSANGTVSQLHERMPVILEPRDWPIWLGEVAGDAPARMHPAADNVLHLWPVSRAVNSLRNNEPDLLDQIDDPAAPRQAMRLLGETPPRCSCGN